MIYPQNFENKIGFDQIREMIKNHCLCELGIEYTNSMKMADSFTTITQWLNETDEFKEICIYEENFPADNYIDVTSSLKKARIEGRFLEIDEVFNLRKSLEAIKSVLRFFKDSEGKEKYPVLRKLAGNIHFFPFVLDKIEIILTKTGRIKDNASPELSRLRKEIALKQSGVNKRLEHILKKAKQEGIAEDDAVLNMRNGRLVIPVSATNKRKINGFIHDESATGKTFYIEPAEVVELNNELKELEYAENREIIKILISFTDSIRPYIDDLTKNYEFLGYIDFLRAKALFSIKIEAIKPVVHDEQLLNWISAKHPLLFLSHKKINKEIIPLNISLNEENRILLISGPNAGGKSVCLKTVGLLQYMMQNGLLVPMSENSEMGIFSEIFIDIGDEQSLENDLSTYSSHLLNMKFFTKNSSGKTLLLIDEFGAGTEPMLGGAIAEAILENLNSKEVFGVVTTHYANLKHYASSTPGIINGAMLFDTGRIQPLYKLEIGKPGSSFAIDIARKIGLSEDILKTASEKVGQDHVQFDKHLREIIRDKKYWEEKRDKIRISEKKLQNVLDQYTEELNQSKKQHKEILAKAKHQAEEILSKANREIENTIRIIKESQAEKEKTREARKILEEFKETIKVEPESDENLAVKLEKIEKIGKSLGKSKPEEEKKKPGEESKIGIGDKVKLVNQETVGEVLDVHGDSIMVAFGNMVTTVKEVRLLKISKNEAKRIKKSRHFADEGLNISQRKLNFKPEIDIRGKRVEEAMDIIKKFIDEAVMVSSIELRILHGKGNGILKQTTREFLNTIDVVKSCHDEQVEFGGSGITVVELEL